MEEDHWKSGQQMGPRKTLAASGHLLSTDVEDRVLDVDVLILDQVLVQNSLVDQQTRRGVRLRLVVLGHHLSAAAVDQGGQKQNEKILHFVQIDFVDPYRGIWREERAFGVSF